VDHIPILGRLWNVGCRMGVAQGVRIQEPNDWEARQVNEWVEDNVHTCAQCERAVTLDHYDVVPGLRVWDYDLRVRVVAPLEGTYADPKSEYHDSWDGFYTMIDPVTGSDRCSKMTGDRMWVRHPTTREQA
jgi:hypothetical protein